MKSRLILSMAVLIFAFGTISATAQQADASPGVDVSPGVARISLAQGDVSTQRGDSGEWAAAVLNAPIVTGDKVSTGDNARAEVQLDFANILRLGDRTQATIANMTRDQIQVQIGEGIANYDALKDADASVEVDTPNVSIRPDKGGSSFRIIVHGGDETQVIVRRGSVDVSTPQGDTRVGQGQIITIHGTGDDTAYKMAEAPPQDDWDSWVNERNDRIENAKSWQHTDRYYTGSEDLDAYGQWKNVPDYGSVWVPTQGPDWAPYRDGRWVWEPYYGWTWVPYEPWGWAPYHYGRWMYYDSAWAWWPGPVYAAPYYRPVWAPAYVSFFGFGGGVGFSVGFGFGSFGWLPCGPGDFYHPWWGGYRNNYNVVNITNVNVYNNRGGEWGGWGPLHRNGYSNVRLATTNEHIQRGISTLPAGGFGTGRMQARAVDSNVFRNGHLMTGNLPVVPSRESLSASNRQASMSTIRGRQQHFFGKARPANVQSFDRQASQVEHSIQSSGRFTPVRSGEQLRAQNGSPNSSQRDTPDARSRNSIAKPSPEVRNPGDAGARNTAMPRTNEVRNPANTNTRNNNGSANDGFTRFGQQNRGNTVQENRGNTVQENRGSSVQENRGNQGSFGGRNVPRPPQNGQPENSRATGSEQNGWHRFGDTGSQSRGSNGSFSNSGSQPRNNGGFSNSGSRDVARPSGSYGNSNSNGSFGNRSVPRPPSSNVGSSNNGGDYRPFGSARGSNEPANRGGYSSSPSSRGSQPNYGGGSSSYPSRSSQPNYGGYPSRESQPSYGGSSGYPSRGSQPSYSRPSDYPSSRGAAPSYGGGRQPSYSQPSSRSASRPPLDMRQPIVGGRSSGGSFGSYGGGSHGGGSSSHGSSGSSHGGGSPHSGGRGR